MGVAACCMGRMGPAPPAPARPAPPPAFWPAPAGVQPVEAVALVAGELLCPLVHIAELGQGLHHLASPAAAAARHWGVCGVGTACSGMQGAGRRWRQGPRPWRQRLAAAAWRCALAPRTLSKFDKTGAMEEGCCSARPRERGGRAPLQRLKSPAAAATHLLCSHYQASNGIRAHERARGQARRRGARPQRPACAAQLTKAVGSPAGSPLGPCASQRPACARGRSVCVAALPRGLARRSHTLHGARSVHARTHLRKEPRHRDHGQPANPDLAHSLLHEPVGLLTEAQWIKRRACVHVGRARVRAATATLPNNTRPPHDERTSGVHLITRQEYAHRLQGLDAHLPRVLRAPACVHPRTMALVPQPQA